MIKLSLGLKGKLTLWTSVVLVVSSLCLAVAVYVVTSRALIRQAHAEMKSVVGQTAAALNLWVDSRRRDADAMSRYEVFAAACSGERKEEAQAALTRIFKGASFYENVFLADPDGKLFIDSIDGASIGIELMTIPGFRANVEHARRGEVWVGDAMASPATGRPVSLITAPIYAGDQLAGILGTPIEL